MDSENTHKQFAKNSNLGGSGAPFGRGLGRSGASLGRSWRLLGASWPLFWAFKIALHSSVGPKWAPRGLRSRFSVVSEGFGRGLGEV